MTPHRRFRPGGGVAGVAGALVVVACCAAPAFLGGGSLLAVAAAAIWRPWLGCAAVGALLVAWMGWAGWRCRCRQVSTGVDT